MSERGTSRPPAAAGGEDGGRNGEDGAVARRLRVLGSVCASVLVAVLAATAAIGWSAARPGAGDVMESPPAGAFLAAVGAMLLVLLSSAVHGRILRRQATSEAEDLEELEELEGWAAAEERGKPKAGEEAARLRAYSWATGASFGMLAAAAALGAMVASNGRAPFYGLVICIAALFSMAARWPRRSGFDLALRPDRPDAVSRAAAWRSLAQPFATRAADRADERAGGEGLGMEQGPGPEPVVATFPAAPGSAHGLGGEELPAAGAVAALVGARLRILRIACGAMLLGVALLAVASVMVVRLRVVRPVASTGLSLTLTVIAAVVILAGSRVQAAILARAGRGIAGEPPSAGGARGVAPGMAQLPGAAAAVVGAYAWATLAGFASFVAVAALGLVVAAVTAVARYALVICGVAALGMAARWPRRAAVLGLLRRRRLA